MRKTMMFFIRGSPPMKATGWRPVITVTVFARMSQGIGGPTGMHTGFGPIRAGIGIQTSVVPGLPTITADWLILVGPAGAGFRELYVPRLGFRGGRVTKRLAGLLFHQRQKFRGMDQSLPGRTRIMALDRLLTLLSAILIGTNRVTPDSSSALNATFRSSVRPKMSPTLSPTTM